MTFIQSFINTIYRKHALDTKITFVLPSRRAAVFLKKEMQEKFKDTSFFLPKIYDIDSFMKELSQLESIDRIDLLFELYNIYLKRTPKDKIETFDKFISWASVLLQDFNDIDAYLVDIDSVFTHIEDIKRIEAWQVDGQDTALVKRYKNFWKEIRHYYKILERSLLATNKGYQGLQYREAIHNLEYYKSDSKIVFAGFNALTKAEEVVIQHLLNADAEIYWDIDKRIYNDYKQESGLFIRKYVNTWNYYKNNKITWLSENFKNTAKRPLEIIGASKSVGQANYVNELLKKNNFVGKKTALILNDENLLNPVLNTLSNIENINITMGFPIKYSSYSNLFETLFKLYENGAKYGTKTKPKYYYKDIVYLLSNPLMQTIISKEFADETIYKINKYNWVFIGEKQLLKLFFDLTNIHYIFTNKLLSPQEVITKCLHLISQLQDEKSPLNNEYLLHFYKLFNKLNYINKKQNFINNVKTLASFYKQLLSQETIDLQGQPLQGLQLMGMLESRVLDFDTIILTSVNEGVLPSGKSNNSFIPFEVRITNELPTYQERDAIFSYHFFRLLYRAKRIFLLYDTEQGVFGSGEQSRFLLQLKNEWQDVFDIKEKMINTNIINNGNVPLVIPKNNKIIERLEAIAADGFSPSSLANYIRNPIDFYYKKILKIKEENHVDEEVAANTFGTIIHNTLEELYKPYIDTVLTTTIMESLKKSVHTTVTTYFLKEYKNEDYQKGKNKIAFEVAIKYILDFLNREITSIKAGNKIIIRYLETEFRTPLQHSPFEFPIYIKGIVDRIDELNGAIRIIDYKTGAVTPSNLSLSNWELLLTKNKEKAFQLMTYAYLLAYGQKTTRDTNRKIINTEKTSIKTPFEVGILSFKNQSKGFMPFYFSEKKIKNSAITADFITNYELQLQTLLTDIFDISKAFEEEVI